MFLSAYVVPHMPVLAALALEIKLVADLCAWQLAAGWVGQTDGETFCRGPHH